MTNICHRICTRFERNREERTSFFPICILMVLVMVVSGSEYGLAGQHCGAKGDWRNILIPDKWPPPETKKRFPSVLGKIKTVPVYKACMRHDDCYGTPGANRNVCDRQFFENMKTECDRVFNDILELHLQQACKLAARGYYKAVKDYGMQAFQKAQNKSSHTAVASTSESSDHNHTEKERAPVPPISEELEKSRTAERIDKEEKSPTPGVTGPLFFNSDFEAGDLTNWTAEGDAFQYQPIKGDNPTARKRKQASCHQGDFWIGSFERYRGKPNEKPGDVQGDKPTGSLRSITFRITGNRIGFLIGGGKKMDALSVVLMVENREIYKTSGKNSETMERMIWDVEKFQGKSARIIINDASSNGWGHINVDDFRFM